MYGLDEAVFVHEYLLKMRFDYKCIKLAHEAQGWRALSRRKLIKLANIISLANILRRRGLRKDLQLLCNHFLEPNQQTRLRNS